MKVFVIGLDGCSWTLLNPWIEQGELPFMRKLRENGCWGESESCLPPVTSPNWRCYSTGTNPGKLGVFWWENIDYRSRRLILPRADHYHGKELWDYLSDAGFKVAVINMPTTYPPRKVNGVMVSGGPDALETGYTYPSQLEQTLVRALNYRVHPKGIGVIDQDPLEAARLILPLIDLRFRAAELIVKNENPDFVHLTLYYINVLQHHLWRHPLVLKAWRIIDQNLSELQRKLPEWNFIFMVDHGTNRVDTQFNISTWMEKEGYLVLRENYLFKLLPVLGLSRERVVNIAKRLGIKDWLKARTSLEVRGAIPSVEGIVAHTGRAALINWERSKAVPSGQGPIYINPDLSAHEQFNLRSELKRRLLELRDDQGKPVVKQVFEKQEVYWGSFLDKAPDLIVDQADGIHISASIGFKKAFQRPTKWLAENHKYGLFAVLGSDMATGALSDRIRIMDIAPTILHAYGLSVPASIDGKVLRHVFAVNSEAYRREVRYCDNNGISKSDTLSPDQNFSDEITRRLAELGYL